MNNKYGRPLILPALLFLSTLAANQTASRYGKGAGSWVGGVVGYKSKRQQEAEAEVRARAS